MFNYDAEQLLVLQPNATGGGLISFLLSLDSRCASVNFKKLSVEQKINDWNQWVTTRPSNAELYGWANFGSEEFKNNLQNADSCDSYVWKCHFLELDHPEHPHPILQKFSQPIRSVGIFVTDQCLEKLNTYRGNNHRVGADYYEKWVYSNQKMILKHWLNVECVRAIRFLEMLDLDNFTEYMYWIYKDLDLTIDMKITRQAISDWHSMLKGWQ